MAVIQSTGTIKPTPGTPLPAIPLAHQTTILNNYGGPIEVAGFVVRALSSNSVGNKCYLLNNNSPADKVAYTNVLWYFEIANEAISFTSGAGNNVYALNQLYIDCDNLGDGVMITWEIY